MRRILCLLVLTPAALVAAPADVSAQIQQQPGQARRQYQGLFGGGTTTTASSSGHRLTLNANFGTGYDDDLRIDVIGSPVIGPTGPAGPTVNNPVLRTGAFSMAGGSLDYGFSTDTVQISASGNGLARYYRDDADPLVGTGDVHAALSVKLSERTSFMTSHNIGVYQQNLGYVGGIGGDPFVGAPTTFIDAGTYAGASSDFSLNQRVTSRVSAHAGYGFYWNNVQYVQGPSGYSGQTGRAGVSVALAQNLNVHTTYTYTKSESDSLNAWDGHAVNFGLDFGQAISLSRNSSMGFGIGVAGVKDSSARSRYYATGFANYSYDIGRSWAFSAGYFRSVDFFQVLAQPVFLDAGTAQIGGALGRRVSLNTSVGIVSGLIGLQDPAPRYVALSGTVSVQVGLTKQLAIGAHYSLYSYQIDETALLPIGMLSRFDRQSVALSLDVWLPLISGSRRLNASR